MTGVRRLRRLLPNRRRTEQGYAAILVAAMTAAVMLPLCAISVDIARLYVEAQRLQNAADAASMAGVTFMPDDFTSAQSTAIKVAKRNGFDNTVSGINVYVEQGSKPTQLKVTITSRVFNTFASSFNASWATVSRYSVADYNGPAPMGSPCNAFGNEPKAGAAEPLGSGSQIVQPTGGAACLTDPQFWAAIAGPDTPKGNGDEIMTRSCEAGKDNSGCSGTVNDEFDPLGYFYIVRVGAGALNSDVTLQIFDPAFVENGDFCDTGPNQASGFNWVDAMNPFTSDGLTRYKKGATNATPTGGFCTGDVLNGSDAVTTSFALRAPTDTYRPVNGQPVLGTDNFNCERQYKGYKTADVTSKELAYNSGGNNGYSEEKARVYHQWVNMCTFRPSVAGDYYLQIRTNVAVGGTADGLGGYRGNANVYTQTGDNTAVKGNGNNRFALRVTGSKAGSVSISGWEHMGIYANYAGANTEFNLVRVIPAAASKSLLITFFDVGDATDPGTIQVLPPKESGTNLSTPLTGCTGSGVQGGPLADCKLTDVSSGSGWNGKVQTIRVPIPTSYTCLSNKPGACWFRLKVSFPGSVSDTTTWSARVEGDPVRLIE